MKYSIIISYRNREEHLKLTVPRIREVLKDKDFEIIVSEQSDNKIFRQYNLCNVGAQVASGDLFIFHDVDYYPVDVEYWDGSSQLFLPANKVQFVYMDLTPKPINEVPGGYQHFINGIDSRMGVKAGEASFFGGVLTFTKEAFIKVNGFSPVYKGWGPGDVDMRARVEHYGISYKRGTGFFYALDHINSGPPPNDPVFIQNQQLLHGIKQRLNDGLTSRHQPTKKIVKSKLDGVDIWVESTDHDAPVKQPSQIISSIL